MWRSRLFGSLPMLLDFVNAERLAHDQFKIVIVPPRIWQRRGNPRLYLIYHAQDADAAAPVGAVSAIAGTTTEREEAVETATRIIADALHQDEGPER